MAQILDGVQIALRLEQSLLKRVKGLAQRGVTPSLAVVMVDTDRASATYVRNKEAAAKRVGIHFERIDLPESTPQSELIAAITEAQTNKSLSGLIVQLPLPKHLETAVVLNVVRPERDVDCLTNANLGALMQGEAIFIPPTPAAILVMLDEIFPSLSGKQVTIIGTGALVGRPLAILLMQRGATVTTCNSRTVDLAAHCQQADIIVTAVGKKDLLRGEMVRPGAIVIDAGISFAGGKMFGDVAFAEVAEKAGYLTPTPGGVGPVTVACLLMNTVAAAEKTAGLY